MMATAKSQESEAKTKGHPHFGAGAVTASKLGHKAYAGNVEKIAYAGARLQARRATSSQTQTDPNTSEDTRASNNSNF